MQMTFGATKLFKSVLNNHWAYSQNHIQQGSTRILGQKGSRQRSIWGYPKKDTHNVNPIVFAEVSLLLFLFLTLVNFERQTRVKAQAYIRRKTSTCF